MNGAAPSVVIADDHPATRLGVRMALMRGGFRVLAEVADGDGAVRAVRREHPDVCLLDVRMPGGGIQAAATLAAVAPATAVVMLTVSERSEDVLAALRAGALGYLPKDTSPDRLPSELRGVLTGEPALPRALVGHVLHELRPPPDPRLARGRSEVLARVQLTSRESEVMHMLGAGLRTVEIGASLSLSPVTVRRHISAVVAKLGVGGREEALRALTRGRR
ncbi:MAG TPA: response regulator transcription factor [Solirubrobacteraceae bacterium]